jgi:O-antigen/teichoic acid export membrane protein
LVSIKRASSITVSSQIVTFAASLLISILLARMLGPENRGIYAILTLIPIIVVGLSSFGLDIANAYFTANKRFEVKDIVGNSLTMVVVISIFVALASLALSSTHFFQAYLKHININLYYFGLMMIAIPINLVFTFFSKILLGKSDFMRFSLVSVSQGIAQLLILVVLILIANHSLSAAVYSYLIAAAIASSFTMSLIYRITRFEFALNLDLLKKSINYGGRAYVGNFAQFLNYRLDMFFVSYFLTAASVGHYAIAAGIAEKLWMIPGAFGTVLFPKVSSNSNDESSIKLTSKVTRNSFTIIITLAIMLALLSKPLILILFGKIFLPAVQPLLILLPGVIMLSLSKVLTGDLSGRGRPDIGAASSIVSLAVNIPLCFFLIPKWGINGAAFSSSIAYSIATIIVVVAFVRLTKTPLAEIILFSPSDIDIYMSLVSKLKSRIILKTGTSKKGEANFPKQSQP